MSGNVFYATGKRKTAVARVWMRPGNGEIIINKKPADEYLSRDADRVLAKDPLRITDTVGHFDIQVTVTGGGPGGQAGAIRHGLSRALVEIDPSHRDILKRQGFLTRDDRMKERKKYGQRGARARFQYSKR